ncbi:hypothetical protein HOO54_15455 [Bacillus sp. WMMC1349]|uniref:hypothetical protein n=1 Tax=Bacillus sp. WMMC1349 TaxID=2736254 RepID=UPI00155595A5|nr:hypothetical protein [Bacillus sp. WMMC1349]NPC93595.1 hypothetical protein [Bacillus sp. WMMC1349]
MQVLKMTEMDTYDLYASNYFRETFTGKDMFSEKVSAKKQTLNFIDATLSVLGAKQQPG